jgi:hypothetical protein
LSYFDGNTKRGVYDLEAAEVSALSNNEYAAYFKVFLIHSFITDENNVIITHLIPVLFASLCFCKASNVPEPMPSSYMLLLRIMTKNGNKLTTINLVLSGREIDRDAWV